jgi:hypothetical protein
MRTIQDHYISRLYTWTVRDLELIYDRCFKYNHANSLEEGPTSSFAILLAALFDIWGSIMRDKFGTNGQTNNNVKHVLRKLHAKDNNGYKIIIDSKLHPDIVKLFRHNLVHNFGKSPEGPEFLLNIDTKGNAIDQQESNQRWHINCKKLKEDFLNLLRLELPNMLK